MCYNVKWILKISVFQGGGNGVFQDYDNFRRAATQCSQILCSYVYLTELFGALAKEDSDEQHSQNQNLTE